MPADPSSSSGSSFRSQSKGLESIYATILIFGVVTALIYSCFFRPRSPHPRTAARSSTATTAANNHRSSHSTTSNSTNRGFSNDNSSFGSLASIKLLPVLPSHVTSKFHEGGDPMTLLHKENWMVSWNYCNVAHLEHDETVRKARARLLSRLLWDATQPPPGKGSTVVLGVPADDLECPHLRRAVYLLATYYNLILLVATQTESRKRILERLRGKEEVVVSPQVLPDHRVVRTGSATGRIAFCRQMERTDWILDFDPKVRDELSRFNYPVFLYGDSENESSSSSNGKGVSRLGQVLAS